MIERELTEEEYGVLNARLERDAAEVKENQGYTVMRGYVYRLYMSSVDDFVYDDSATVANVPGKMFSTQMRCFQMAVVLRTTVVYESKEVVLISKPVPYGRRHYFGLSRVTRVGFGDLSPEDQKAWGSYLQLRSRYNVFVELENGTLYPIEDDAVVVSPPSVTP